MGTLQKSQKCHEKSINTMQLLKNSDFQLRNGFDHQHEAIWRRSWKIVIFDAKIVRNARNHKNWTPFLANYLVLVLKTLFNSDFSENPRWGPYKNRKNVTKNRSTRGNCWKPVIFSFGTASFTSTRQFGPEAENSWFLTRKSSGPLEIPKTEHLF